MALNWLKWFQRKAVNATRLAVAFDEDGFSYALVDHSDNKPKLKDCGFSDCATPESLINELKHVCSSHHFEGLSCSLILSPEQYSYYLLDAPDVDFKDFADSLKWKIKDYLDYPIEDAALDFIELPKSKFLDKKMVYQIAARKDLINQQVNMMRHAGFDINIVDIPEVAISNIAKLLKESDQGEAFIKLHPKQSKVILVHRGKIFLMRNIDVNISEIYNKSSEHLDLEGKAQIRRLADDLALEIRRSMDYCTSVLKHSITPSLVFSPVVFACNEFIEEMRSVLGCPAKMLDYHEIVDFDTNLNLNAQNRCFLALGAALRSFDSDGN